MKNWSRITENVIGHSKTSEGNEVGDLNTYLSKLSVVTSQKQLAGISIDLDQKKQRSEVAMSFARLASASKFISSST